MTVWSNVLDQQHLSQGQHWCRHSNPGRRIQVNVNANCCALPCAYMCVCCDTPLSHTQSSPVFMPLSSFVFLSAHHQLYGMYVGEGEAVLRDTFRRARLACPAIIFLDEADALAPRRQEGGGGDAGGGAGDGGPDAGLRLLSTLLTEIDGLEETQGACVVLVVVAMMMRGAEVHMCLCVACGSAGRVSVYAVCWMFAAVSCSGGRWR